MLDMAVRTSTGNIAPEVAKIGASIGAVAAADASSALTLASSKSAVFYQATAPTNPQSGYSLRSGDIWFSNDTTTNCPDSNCKGHTADGNGNPQVGTYPHRALYWAHRWNGSAWVDGAGQQTIIASEIAAGAIIASKIAADALQTSDYAETSPEDGPTLGAKMVANTTYPDWAANTAYVTGDIVATPSGKLYVCIASGTSATSSGKSAWSSGTSYALGDLVLYSNQLWESLSGTGNQNKTPDRVLTPNWWRHRGHTTNGPDGLEVITLGGGQVVLWPYMIRDGDAGTGCAWRPYAQLRAGGAGLQLGKYTVGSLWQSRLAVSHGRILRSSGTMVHGSLGWYGDGVRRALECPPAGSSAANFTSVSNVGGRTGVTGMRIYLAWTLGELDHSSGVLVASVNMSWIPQGSTVTTQMIPIVLSDQTTAADPYIDVGFLSALPDTWTSPFSVDNWVLDIQVMWNPSTLLYL
jgi:hypothetical protein